MELEDNARVPKNSSKEYKLPVFSQSSTEEFSGSNSSPQVQFGNLAMLVQVVKAYGIATYPPLSPGGGGGGVSGSKEF